MTEEYFNSHVLRCERCGSIPKMIKETKGSLFSISDKNNDTGKYRIVCWTCKWDCGEMGNKTGLCKSPENALKVWNKKYGAKNKD